MTDKSRVLGALQAAMRAEHEGYHFYSMAAKQMDDPKGKEVLLMLAAEEMDHFSQLKNHYSSVLQTGHGSASVQLSPPVILSGDNPIFSDDIKSRIQSAHYEMTILSVAAQLELDASLTYEKYATEFEDPMISDFFRELAVWERKHYEALVKQQEILKEEYWAANNFAPF